MPTFVIKFFKTILNHWPVLITAAVLGLLLFRNPYSTRNLIANFEPFPDSFHYVVPPTCFLQGQGWKMCREGLPGIAPSVPPLYGILLLPVLGLFSDPRSFYFVNVLLAFVSLTFLYLLIKRLTTHQFIQLLVLTLFVTTYQVYWIPTLAMAENLVLPIFLGVLWLMSAQKLKLWQIAGISTLAGLQYGSKFAGLPLMTGICAVLGIRLLLEHFSQNLKFKATLQRFAAAVLPVLFLFLLFGGWKTISGIIPLDFFSSSAKPALTQETTEPANVWFGTQFFSKNSAVYLQALRGESTRFLWDYTPLIATWIAVLGWFGLGYGVSTTKWRWVSITAITTALLQVVILSFFYTNDTRYIYNILPTVLLGVGLFFIWLKDLLTTFKIRKPALAVAAICILLLGGYSLTNFTRLKLQVGLNLKYAETPWWYLAIEEMNTYFTEFNNNQAAGSKETIVISPMAPYLIDFYQTAEFRVLPLDQMQDFRGTKKEVWGEDDYSDLLALYQQKIEAGHPVFVAIYGIGNEKSKQNSLAAIKEFFELEKVQTGCFEQCDIFRVELKTKTD